MHSCCVFPASDPLYITINPVKWEPLSEKSQQQLCIAKKKERTDGEITVPVGLIRVSELQNENGLECQPSSFTAADVFLPLPSLTQLDAHCFTGNPA